MHKFNLWFIGINRFSFSHVFIIAMPCGCLNKMEEQIRNIQFLYLRPGRRDGITKLSVTI